METFEKEKDYFTQTENNLRIQVQRLKEAVKEMKIQMEEMTSDEAKKLKEKEKILAGKERKLAVSQANIENERNMFADSQVSQNPENQGHIILQLKKALEEVHVLRDEKQYLLERCNKLSHEIKLNTIQQKDASNSNSAQENKLENVENLQYQLTKQQLGLVALSLGFYEITRQIKKILLSLPVKIFSGHIIT
jgi:hypothetical protein